MHTPEYGAAFIGIMIGGILYGMTILQAVSYFRIGYGNDSLWMKVSVALLCLLDTLHLCFSVHMMYFYLINNFGNVKAVFEIVWSLKGLGTVQVLLIWLVQCLYLARIWKLSRKIVKSTKISSALLAGLIVTVIMAFGVGIMFIIKMDELRQGLSLAGFRWAIFFGFSVTIAVDVFIAGVMSFLLYSQTGMKRTDSILFTLIQYIIGTGVLTSAASIVYIILYVVKPDTLLYLAQEFSITRLYTNSFLAMMNARSTLRGQMCEPVDIEINLTNSIRFSSPSSSLFGDKTRKHYQTPPETPVKPAKTSLENDKTIPPPPCLGHDNYNRSEDILLDRVQ